MGYKNRKGAKLCALHKEKGGYSTNQEKLNKELAEINKELSSLKKTVRKLPKGNLLINRNGRYYKWLNSDGHTHTYILKKNRGLAEQLAYKKYCKLRISKLEIEKAADQRYLDTMSKVPHPSSDELLLIPEYSELLHNVIDKESYKYKDWAEDIYEKNPYYPEHLTVQSITGHLVRSKSEAMICSALRRNNIAFRYECALELDGITYYPDFTIRHPKTGEMIYWEHLGLMDNPDYIESSFKKLKVMADNGIIVGLNLIITSETAYHPLSEYTINEVISQYLI